MCGVVGIYHPDPRRVAVDSVRALLTSIGHRGPDGSDVWVSEHIGLGHGRLAIQDLTDLAAQPMRSQDGRLVIAFNGEVFNFYHLRDQLKAAGRRVRSTGDTEVLVEHISHFGLDLTLEEAEGDFAFALWDMPARSLTLVRDRHGVKPLYYTTGDVGEVRFGSELKAMVVDGGAADITSATAALMGLSPTWGDRTMFENVRSVQPGEVLTFSGSTIPGSRIFHTPLDFVDDGEFRHLSKRSDEEIVDAVTEALETSVRLRLLSDAPVACLVSGGLDSSLITTLAARQTHDISLFHADVEGDSERDAAEQLARWVGLPLEVTEVGDSAFLDAVAEVTYFNDVPLIYHLNSVPFYLVSKLASEAGIKVLLTGEGADEYFLGYPQLGLEPYLRKVDRVKGGAQATFQRALPRMAGILWPRADERFSALAERLAFRYEEEIVRQKALDALGGDESIADRGRVHSLVLVQQHLLSLLHRNDRLGMAWGLEARFPFLGHDLARIAVNLPMRHKLRSGMRFHDPRHPFIVDKWAVRASAARVLPPQLSQRRKKGFPVSVYSRLRVQPGLFHDGFVCDSFGLSASAVRTLCETASPIWLTRLMLLEAWAQIFLMGLSVEDTQKWLRAHVTLTGRSARARKHVVV